ncbi:MAG: hypothetical protein PCFJNLEI_03743 [Verrucomicrobiae bacterium]|nr:hypothetical protein [Verrucomicrobiae bacterium]
MLAAFVCRQCGGAGGAEAGLREWQVCVAAGEDVVAVGHLGDGIGAGWLQVGIDTPLGEAARVAVVADKAAPEPVRRKILFAAVQDVTAEENDVAGLGGNKDLVVSVGDAGEHILGVVAMGDALDVGDVADEFITETVADFWAGRIDGFDLAVFGKPHRAVEFVAVINCDPCAAECVGVRGDVIGVLVPTLAGFTGRLEEQHRLQRENVGADQDFEHVEHARVQHVALVELEFAVKHMEAEKILCFFDWGEVRRWGFESLGGHAVVLIEIAFGHLCPLLRQTALHQVFGVLPEFGDFGGGNQAGDDKKTITTKTSVLFNRDLVSVEHGGVHWWRKIAGEVEFVNPLRCGVFPGNQAQQAAQGGQHPGSRATLLTQPVIRDEASFLEPDMDFCAGSILSGNVAGIYLGHLDATFLQSLGVTKSRKSRPRR